MLLLLINANVKWVIDINHGNRGDVDLNFTEDYLDRSIVYAINNVAIVPVLMVIKSEIHFLSLTNVHRKPRMNNYFDRRLSGDIRYIKF